MPKNNSNWIPYYTVLNSDMIWNWIKLWFEIWNQREIYCFFNISPWTGHSPVSGASNVSVFRNSLGTNYTVVCLKSGRLHFCQTKIRTYKLADMKLFKIWEAEADFLCFLTLIHCFFSNFQHRPNSEAAQKFIWSIQMTPSFRLFVVLIFSKNPDFWLS